MKELKDYTEAQQKEIKEHQMYVHFAKTFLENVTEYAVMQKVFDENKLNFDDVTNALKDMDASKGFQGEVTLDYRQLERLIEDTFNSVRLWTLY